MTAILLAGCSTDEMTYFTGYGHIRFALSGDYDLAEPVTLQLTSADGEYSHNWESVSEFPEYENFMAGEYSALALQGDTLAQGVCQPAFTASSHFILADDEIHTVPLYMNRYQAAFSIDMESAASLYSVDGMTLHCRGSEYVPVSLSPAHEGYIYTVPGSTECSVTVTDPSGRSVSLAMPGLIDAVSGADYMMSVSATDEMVIVSSGEVSMSRKVSDLLFVSEPPEIECHGFTDGMEFTLTEGFPSQERIVMHISAPAGIESIVLTGFTDFPLPEGLPSEADVLEFQPLLEQYGLSVVRVSDTEAVIDFTTLLENISVSRNTAIQLLLRATDRLGRVSEPAALKADIQRVNLEVSHVTAAELGLDETTVSLKVNVPQIQIGDFSIHPVDDPTSFDFSGSFDSGSGTVTLRFTIPEGIEPYSVCVDYLSQQRLTLDIPRRVPPFNVIADPFATYSIMTVTGASENACSTIARHITLQNAPEGMRIFMRDAENQRFVVSVLAPGRMYDLSFHVPSAQETVSVKFTTETERPLPGGDFEDAEPWLKYPSLASGGSYSASAFPIYNMQNHIDYDLWWPKKHWASVNDKTFCKDSRNHNSWYMQPSTVLDFTTSVSGSKSMRISSVGWSLDGPEIQPTTQTDDVYRPYNTNVPPLDNVTAGRLFLGSYTFDSATGSERFSQGVPFDTRPSSLNGFYKYMTDANVTDDLGFVRIELVNDSGESELTVASAETRLSPSPDFKSFNLPLQYFCYNIKPTRLKLMFCSSDRAGDLSGSDPEVPVTADIPTASFIGSVLWVDNLSFSY